MMTMMRIAVVVVVVALVEFPAVRMSDVVATLAFLGSRHVGKIGLLGLEQVAEFRRFFSLVKRDGRRRRIANGSLAAVAGHARPLGWGKGIAIFLEELLVLALPRRYFCAEGVAHLVAGGDGGDFFPHVLPKLEETATRVVDGQDNGLGHLHLFLLAGGNVVCVGIVSQNPLKGSVAWVVCANPGLSTENVFRFGNSDAGTWFVVVVLFIVCLPVARRRWFALFLLHEFGDGGGGGELLGVQGYVSWQFRCDYEILLHLDARASQRNNRCRFGVLDIDIGSDVAVVDAVHNVGLIAFEIEFEIVE